MLQRIKRAYKAFVEVEHDLLRFDSEVMKNLSIHKPVEGDGKAEFLGEGTTEEYEDMLKDDKGEKKWYDRIKNLI